MFTITAATISHVLVGLATSAFTYFIARRGMSTPTTPSTPGTAPSFEQELLTNIKQDALTLVSGAVSKAVQNHAATGQPPAAK